MTKKILGIVIMITLGFWFSGCATQQVTIEKAPPAKYEVLGQAKGTGNGSLAALSTAYYFIPLGLNTRIESAYADALQSVPGATGLINVTYQEDWFWWIIGTNRKVTIAGDAIKEIR